MNSFRIVDTSFRILKGGKIGLAASIALIGGMLTLGSTSANAETFFSNNVTLINPWSYAIGGGGNETLYVDYAYNSGSTSGLRTSTSTSDNVVFDPSYVSKTFTGVSWNGVSDDPSVFNLSYSTNVTPTYNITFNSGANANNIYKDAALGYTTETNSSTWGVPQDGTDYANIVTYNAGTSYTANLIFQGTNVVSGNTDIDAGNIELRGGVTFAGTVQAGSADVYTSSQITFNDHVDLIPGSTDTLTFHNGGNVVLNNGLSGNVDFNGQNATVTLSNGDIAGDINTSTNGSGTLKFTTSTASSVLGDIGTTANLKEIIMDGTGSVDVNGSVDTNLVTFNSAGTLQVNSLDTTRGDNTLGTVNFKEFNGTLKVDGGDLTGNMVTDLNNNGIVTMMNGSQSITGQIGTSTNKIKTLNIGDTGEDSNSVTTMNGDIYAQNIVFNNLSNTNSSELRIADDYDVTATITTADNEMGTLKLLGGTQTVNGQVGTNGMRLAEVNSGANGATSTFKNSVYAKTVQNLGTGSSTFESAVHATNVNVDNSNEDSETTTGSVVTFKDTVDSSFINITGNGVDSVPSVSFEKLVTVSDNVVITDAEVTVGKAAAGLVPAVPANMTVGNDVTIRGSIVDVTGNLNLTGGASTLTIQDSSEFNITGNVALTDTTGSTSSIEIKDSKATFNGTVIVADNNGNLNISDSSVASLVKFNDTVNVGNDITITNTISGGDAYTLVSQAIPNTNYSKLVYTSNPNATTVAFNENITTGNDLSVDNSVVSFGNLASGTGENAIAENAVVANIENNLNLTNSYVTLNGDLNVTNDMTVKNSYGKFTASGVNASVTVGNTLTVDDTNNLNNVSFITVDSKLNVGEDFVVSGNDNNNNNNNSFLKVGEETAIVLNDNVTVGNDLSISSAFVSLLGSGNGEDALNVSNNVDVNNSLLAMKGGDITVGLDMAVNSSSQLIVGVVDYYTYMTDFISNNGTPIGDYSANSSTNMDIGRDLTINHSMAMFGNEAGLSNGTFGKNTVNVTVANDVNIENGANVTMSGNLELTGDTSNLAINNSTATFNGTVTVASANGDLRINDSTRASNVTFNDTVTVGDSISTTGYGTRNTLVTFNDDVTTTNGDISFTNSTIKMGNAGTEEIDANSITVNAGRDFVVNYSNLEAYVTAISADNVTLENSSNVDITGNVNVSNNMNVYTYANANIIGNINVVNNVNVTGSSITDITGNLTLTGEDSTLTINNSLFEITGSTILSSINYEYNYSGDIYTYDSNTSISITNSDATFNGTVTVASASGDLSIHGSEVAFNDTVAVGGNLEIVDSAVTFDKAVTIGSTSYIYTNSETTNVHFKDTVMANDDIYVGNYYSYGNDTTVTFDKNLTITTGEDSFGTLHLSGNNVTVNANGDIYANVQFGEDAELNVADTKNIYGTVSARLNQDGILNFLGTTTLQGDIGEDSRMLTKVNFAGTGENEGSFTQDIGYNVYSYNTYIGNSYNQVKANITNDITFGGDVEVRNGSTLNVSNKDVNVGALYLDSGSTTSFKVYTTDISAGQAVENANSGSITTDYALGIDSNAKINIAYDGSWNGAGKYNLISTGEDGFAYGEDYVGTEANGLVTDNSIIDSVVKRYVDTDGKEYLTLYADRTGGGSYAADDLYIEKSGIGTNYSNGASQSLAGYADETQREGALADIIKKMEDLKGGVVVTDEKKQELVKAQKLLAPVANNSGLQSSLNASNLALGTIGGRISDVRGAGGSILALNDNSSNATGLSAGESTLDTALWIKAVGSTATQDKVGQYDGYDANTYGIVTGFDKTLKDGTILGFALAYSDTNTDQSDFRSGDSSDTNSIQVTAYASKEFGNLYVDGMLSYAKHSTDATRTANSGKLTADIDANQYSAKIESGYRFVLEGDTTLTPFASIEYGTLDQKSYTEKGTTYQNDALKVDDVSINRGTAGLGAKLTTNVKVGNTKLVPEFKLAAYNSFGDDSADIKAQYVGGGNKFITPGQELNQTIYNIGAGVKTAISESSTLILNVDHDRSGDGDFTGYSGSVSYRYSF